jgi:hypothetical protein
MPLIPQSRTGVIHALAESLQSQLSQSVPLMSDLMHDVVGVPLTSELTLG